MVSQNSSVFSKILTMAKCVNKGKLEILLYSLNVIVVGLVEISRGHLAHPSTSREDCRSGMPNGIATHLFFTSLGKAVSLATQSRSHRFFSQ